MDSIIETFHVDWKLLLAQVVNFGVVLAVLYFFALKPVMKVMHNRTSTIEKSLKDAAEIEEKLKRTAEENNRSLVEARKQSLVILEEAEKRAEADRLETVTKAKQEVEGIVAKGRAQLAAEKTKIIAEAKAEVGGLTISAVESILSKGISREIDQKIIEKNIAVQ